MTSTTSALFDAAAYKATTRAQWEHAADAWHRWGPDPRSVARRSHRGDARPRRDRRGGDGCSTSRPGPAARPSRRPAEWGRRARCWPPTSRRPSSASPSPKRRGAGLSNVAVREMDGERLDVDPGFYDAAISRVGLIYFPDQQAALTGILRALRPGGTFATVTYSTPENNRFFSIPVSVIRRRAQLPPPAAGQPGPFSLGAPGVLGRPSPTPGSSTSMFAPWPRRCGCRSAAECVRFERESFGALHQMLSGLDDDGRDAAWAEITEQLRQFENADGFAGPCELLVGAGRRPG